MAQVVQPRTLVITAAFEPRARSTQGRTKIGELKQEARRWRDGLAWSAKLQLLSSQLSLRPPYDVTVNAYFPQPGAGDLPHPREWFEAIAGALAGAFAVDPAQLRVRSGRVGYAPPLSPPHFEIVVAEAAPPTDNVTCPSCGRAWTLEPAQQDDRCPHCGYENAGLPFMLGVL